MRDLRTFREAVREHRRAVGRTQRQLARSIGLHPDVLSHKLNGRDNALLTSPDVVGIITTLAEWGALVTRADADELLDLAGVPPSAVTAAVWAAPPLSALRHGERAAIPSRAPPPRRPPDDAPLGESAAGSPRLVFTALPVPLTPLVGRRQERAAVAAAVAASRLVTLTGAGGIGKTRLALQAAHDLAGNFRDGVAFIDLAPVSDPALLATAMARALGLIPRSADGAEGLLAEALQDCQLLLVLDNLEQLLNEIQLLSRLLTSSPEARMLATSRVPLRLYGEHTLRVPPLRLLADDAEASQQSEAVRLFVTRAEAVGRGVAAEGRDLSAVAGICMALDGLPLAIELAAAKTKLYTPQALLPLLQSRLSVLTSGPRDLPRRQQTLRAALDWSHSLLPASARTLFARLGVFAGPFDAPVAAAVSGPPDHEMMLECLTELADQSLLELAPGETPAFQMLQTVREYALARLAESGEQDDLRRRHLAYYLAMAEGARPGLDGPGQGRLLDRLEAAYPNIRAALDFAWHQAEHDGSCLDEGLRLATAVGALWQRRGRLAEGVLYFDRLLAADDARGRASAPGIRAGAALAACKLCCFNGDYARTADLARHGIELCTPLADHDGMSQAYRMLGEAAFAEGDDDAAEPHFQRELAEASQAGDSYEQANAYNMLGQIARHRREFRHASALHWRALSLFRVAGAPDAMAAVLAGLGEIARDAGHATRARRLFRLALRRHAGLGNKRQMAYELEGLAAAASLDHHGRQALIYLGAAQALRDQGGGPLPPAERAILHRILAPTLAGLSARERNEALSTGHNQPLPEIIAQVVGPAAIQ